MLRGIYVHVPFCRRICPYCDFYRKRRGGVDESFISALIREVEHEGDGSHVETLYFGGGTPSLLRHDQLERILNALDRAFRLKPVEVTLEANPEDVTPENLKFWKSLGINRVSVGIQTFSERGLKTLGRWHTPKAGIDALSNSLSYGMITNADLIFGYPGQTLKEFEEDIETLVKMGVQHVSAYALEIHERTLFGYYHRKGKMEDREDLMAFYILREEMLTSWGYLRYELSNFALPGYESLHNRIYWSRGWYKGFGPSASSFLSDEKLRYTNFPSLARYVREFPPPRIYDKLDEEKDKLEILFLSLRTSSLPLKWYVENFGKEKFEDVKEFLEVKDGMLGVKVKYLHLFDAIVKRMI